MTRPRVQRITIELDNGKTYLLEGEALYPTKTGEPDSGSLFWGDFAVREILATFYERTGMSGMVGADLLRKWADPLPTGELPAFLGKPYCPGKRPDEYPSL